MPRQGYQSQHSLRRLHSCAWCARGALVPGLPQSRSAPLGQMGHHRLQVSWTCPVQDPRYPLHKLEVVTC